MKFDNTDGFPPEKVCEPSLPGLIKIISGRFRAKGGAMMKEYGITLSQCSVVRYLDFADGSAPQKEIVRQLHLSNPTVVGLLSRMEKNGVVKGTRDPSDRRGRIITLTAHGREICQAVKESIIKDNDKARAGLSDKEYAELIRMLKIVCVNLWEDDDRQQKEKEDVL